jgi:predicted amidohydrolase
MLMIGELAAYGPSLEYAQESGGRAETLFRDVARETGLWLIPGSFYERVGARIYNMTPVISPKGEIVGRYRKMYPFLPYERGVASGSEFLVFDVPEVGRFGVSICYDMWFPETTRTLAYLGAEVVLHPTMTNTIDREFEFDVARANAAMNQCYFFDINVTGRLGYGRSAVFGPGGEVLHQSGTNREFIPIEVDFAYLRRVRERGWNGLGQTLKSFRDTPISFPPYANGVAAAGSALTDLGPLEMPQQATNHGNDGARGEGGVIQEFETATKRREQRSR